MGFANKHMILRCLAVCLCTLDASRWFGNNMWVSGSSTHLSLKGEFMILCVCICFSLCFSETVMHLLTFLFWSDSDTADANTDTKNLLLVDRCGSGIFWELQLCGEGSVSVLSRAVYFFFCFWLVRWYLWRINIVHNNTDTVIQASVNDVPV